MNAGKIRLTTTLLLGLAFLLGAWAGPASAREVKCTAVRVHDGDTFTCQAKRKRYQVRVFGIDTPELNRSFGVAAGDRARALLLTVELRLKLHEHDVYGRQVAEVFLPSGESLAEILLREGLARWYARFAPDRKDYAALEAEARQAKRGLWRLGAFPKR